MWLLRNIPTVLPTSSSTRIATLVVSSSADRTVRVFEPNKGMLQRYYTSPPLPGIVTSVTFHPKGKVVVSGCDDGGVRLQHNFTPGGSAPGKIRRVLRASRSSVPTASSSSPRAPTKPCAPGETSGRNRITPHPPPHSVSHTASVTQAIFRPVIGEHPTFITTATNGEVRLVHTPLKPSAFSDTPPPDPSKTLVACHPGAALSASWSRDGGWLATVGGGEVILWEWINDTPAAARLRIVDSTRARPCAQFSPDGRLLVTYGGEGEIVHVWDLTKLPAAP